jgi:hypothetical protein
MDIIYIGSGISAKLINQIDHTKYIVVCVNNAWRLFEENKQFDYWLHSGDFPYENYPKIKNFKTEISYKEYQPAILNLVNNSLKIETKHPYHYAGYTIFFQGLYWIMEILKPQNIYLLGFDHDYNKEKTHKWLENDKPNPQNHYLKDKNQSIKEWSEEFFKGFEYDFFYGHGTPDPVRLGEDVLKEKFFLALENSKKIGVNIFNASTIENTINIFPKIKLNFEIEATNLSH